MKRENGTGCVRRLPGNRKKSYQAVISKYDSSTKKQVFKSLGTFEHRCDAEYELYKYLHNVEVVEHEPGYQKVTIEDIYKQWSELKYKNISENSIRSYKNTYKFLKNILDQDIKTIKLEKLQNECSKLTPSTQKKFKSLAIQLYQYAIANDYTEKNYASYLVVDKEIHKTKDIFTDKEIEYITKQSGLVFDILTILLYTGMRINELCNLKIEDIDLDNKTISIKNAKTAAGVRVIPIHKNIYTLVNELTSKSNTYLLLNRNKRKVNYPCIRKTLLRHFKNHTFHEARHTYITQCRKCKLDNYAIKLLVGHSINDVTLSVYTHMDIEFLRKEIEKFKY